MPTPVVHVIENPFVGVPHKLSIKLDGDTVTGYQWATAATLGSAFANISGATNASFTPREQDAGKFLGCTVTFSSSGEVDSELTSSCLIRKHSAASTGPRFRVTRSSNSPRAKTSFESARESRQS